jgi:hypothetical protein
MSRQANERRMRELVARWQGEGGSATTFAAKHGVSPTKFGYWRRLLSGGGREVKAEPIEFHPVRLVGPMGGSPAALEITFVGGERVLVHEGASAEALAMVVAALRARC